MNTSFDSVRTLWGELCGTLGVPGLHSENDSSKPPFLQCTAGTGQSGIQRN